MSWTIAQSSFRQSPDLKSSMLGIHFIGDGAALAATNILTTTYLTQSAINALKTGRIVGGVYAPDTGSHAPGFAATLTLTNEWGHVLYSHAGLAPTDKTNLDMDEDWLTSIPIFSQLNVSCSDLDAAGDNFHLYLYIVAN